MTKYIRAVVAIAMYVMLLVGTYVAHIRFGSVDVVLYSAVLDAFVAASLGALALFGLRYFGAFTAFEKVQLVVIWLLVGYAAAISVPTVIDRSLSFYILEKLQQRNGGIQLALFEDVFTKEYVKEHRLVDVRLTEQLASGTIEIVDKCVRLTPRGARLASLSRFFRQNFLPKQRLLMGQYSDDLTNPFRNSSRDAAYTC